MEETKRIEWLAPEYEEVERSSDWFWALGIVVVTATITTIIFGNYFFALLIVLAGLLLGFFALKPPEMIAHELGERGLRIKTKLYQFGNIKAFWVEKPTPQMDHLEPKLFIKSERLFMPVISMPIEHERAEEIRQIFKSKNVPEQEMREHLSKKIMEHLGF